MPVINRSALVMFSAAQMYDLINDVSAYSQFLPGCKDSKIVSASADKMIGSILVSKVGMEKWFTTENTLVENTSVSMILKDGPFKSLVGQWQLTPLSEEACKVSLQLDYEFSSKIIEMAFGKVFNTLTNNMVSAFTNRAKEVYPENVS